MITLLCKVRGSEIMEENNNGSFNNKPSEGMNLGLIVGIILAVVVAGIGVVFGSKLFTNKNNTSSNNEKQLNAVPSDYISINTVEDYKKLLDGTYDLSKNYILMKDLDLGSYCKENQCYPIGMNSKDGFTGIFNGNNHIISNYYYNIDDETIYSAGLFSKISEGTVKNLILKDAIIELNNYAEYGIPVGLLSGTANNVLIENCKINGTIKTDGTINDRIDSVGLLIGKLYLVDNLNSEINNKIIKLNDTDDKDYHVISMIKDVSVSGNINITGSLNIMNIGGMIGSTNSSYHNKYGYLIFNAIENCSADVDILLSSVSNDEYKSISQVGGLIGTSSADYVYQSSSIGNIESNNSSNVAGFIGISSTSKIEECYSTGNVKAGKSSAGFISSFNGGTGIEKMGVSNSYSTGNITCNQSYDFEPCVLFINNVGDDVSNNYAVGSVTNSSTDVKRFNSYNSPAVKETNYCSADMINEEKSECTKLSASQMLEKKSYKNFDFNNIWLIEENKSTPKLRWQSK